MTPQEVDQFNRAVSALARLGYKYGARDVTIWHEHSRIRIRIERNQRDFDELDRAKPGSL